MTQYEKMLTSNLCFEYINGNCFEIGNELREWTTSLFDAVICINSGSLKLQNESGEKIEVKNGECIFLPARILRQADFFSDNGISSISNIYFNFTILNSIHVLSLFDIKMHYSGDSAAKISLLVSKLHKLDNNLKIPPIIKEVKKLKIGFLLLDILLINSKLKTNKVNILKRHSRLSKLLSDLNKKPEIARTADGMAKELHVSKSRLYQIFNEFTGHSPVTYLRIQRLEKAASLLLSEDFNVGEISKKLGYNDQFTFSRVFKKHFGVSPSLYRKKVYLL